MPTGVYKRTKPAWNKGISLDKEIREKISRTLKGRKMPYVAKANKKRKGISRPGHKEVMKNLWSSGKMKGRTGLKNSEEMNKKIGDAIRGSKHYLWIADRSQLKKYEGSQEKRGNRYKEWRKQVKERDGHKCKIDDHKCSGRLEVHHILSWTYFPEYRYEIKNGITLCRFHHPLKREEEKRLLKTFFKLIGVEIDEFPEAGGLVASLQEKVLLQN